MASFSLMTWNVNSVRARLDHVLTYLAQHKPDVVCLQETKVEDALFPKVPFLELGYQVHIHGGKAQAGIATLTREPAEDVRSGFFHGGPDKHPRVLSLRVYGVWIYNLYVPNGTELRSDAFAYKLAWYRQLREELDHRFKSNDPLIVTGDMNVALEDRDVYDPEALRGHILFTDEEHAALRGIVDFGLYDCFRKHVQDGGHYSWFDYRSNGFKRGLGLRIDHIYATKPVADRCIRVVHDLEPRGWPTPSDHVPVLAYFS